ncbi:hypothetical protein [Roseomonas sp. USHLN139]|uniref:hypothetical protein n=1 Tax=Roseomonas sp. USHLN139 TaxID=3081298 RepID=UPI003B014F50
MTDESDQTASQADQQAGQSDRWKPWTIKNIPADVRDMAIKRAKADGQEIGEWISRAIRQKIQADRRMPAVVPGAAPAAAAATNVRLVTPAVTLDRIERVNEQVVRLAALGDAVPEPIRKALYAKFRQQLQGKGAPEPEPQPARLAAPATE